MKDFQKAFIFKCNTLDLLLRKQRDFKIYLLQCTMNQNRFLLVEKFFMSHLSEMAKTKF
jgi:hypothetical protein